MKAGNKVDKLLADAAVTRRGSQPWAKLPRNAPPTKAFTLRMNEFEDALLEAVVEAQPVKTSKHAVAKRYMVEALEQAAKAGKL